MKKIHEFIVIKNAGDLGNNLSSIKKTNVDSDHKGGNYNINYIVYGNSPVEFKKVIESTTNTIKNWFEKNGIISNIISNAPLNDSEITKNDLEYLVNLTAKASAEEITFARYVDNQNNLPNVFLDLLRSKGYSETVEDYLIIDSQTDVILNYLKDVINRPRPYQLAKALNYNLCPLIRTDAMTAAYPSGHALTGYVMSQYYAIKYPDIAEDLINLGKKIAHSREVTGIHYPSDTQISKIICDIIFENNLIK